MPQSNLTISFIAFIAIWSIWSIWSFVQPVMTSAQVALLFPLLPASALLLAFSFFDNDDDDNGDGLLQPIYNRTRVRN